MLTLFLTFLALIPPTNIIAVVLFLCAAILAGMAKSWPLCFIAAGLAFAYWPW